MFGIDLVPELQREIHVDSTQGTVYSSLSFAHVATGHP